MSRLEGPERHDSPHEGLVRAVATMAGQRVLEWRGGYADSGSLHIGKQLMRDGPRRRARGEWVLTIWAAPVRVEDTNESNAALTRPPLQLEQLNIGRLSGQSIEEAGVLADGTVWLRIGQSTKLIVLADAQVPENEDQWTLETPNVGSFVVRAGPRFQVE